MAKFTNEENVIKLIKANFVSSIGINITGATKLRNDLAFTDWDYL